MRAQRGRRGEQNIEGEGRRSRTERGREGEQSREGKRGEPEHKGEGKGSRAERGRGEENREGKGGETTPAPPFPFQHMRDDIREVKGRESSYE